MALILWHFQHTIFAGAEHISVTRGKPEGKAPQVLTADAMSAFQE